jgi:hypothetical protein
MRPRGETLSLVRDEFGCEVFTTAMAAAVGISAKRLQRAAAQGTLTRVARGRFCLITDEPDRRARYLSVVDAHLLARPTAAAAGVSAAACWGLPCPDPWGDWGRFPVVLANDRPLHRTGGLVHWRLGARATTTVDQRRATDLPTTAADVARQLSAPEALIVVDAAARALGGSGDRRLLQSPRLRERIRDVLTQPLSATPRPLGPHARATVAWADPAAESPPESYIRGHIRLAGLPVPVVNAPVVGASGRRYFVDLLWPDAMRGLEIDGRVKYTEQAVLHREKRRQEDIEATGLRISRQLAADVFHHPEAVVGAMRAVL